jgi:hypothetical protein
MTRWTESDLEKLQARVVGPTGIVSNHAVPITARVRKYRNKPTMVDDILFDSIAEARRYTELKLLEKGGAITDLQLQPKYVFEFRGIRIGSYKADFRYKLPHSSTPIVEDVKSEASKTQMYRLRKRMLRAFHGIELREVS